MNPQQIVCAAGTEKQAAALETFLTRYLTPAFGTLPKAEIDLLVLNLLEDMGAINKDSGVYELVSKLRVTRSKARNLIYQRELRTATSAQLDLQVRKILQRPIIQKAGDVFVLEVENPLVADHLRAKVQSLGYASDGSFSPNIVKLSLDAITALLESNLTVKEREDVREALIAAGAPDISFRGILKATLKKLASKVAANTGEEMLEEVSNYMKPIVEGAVEEAKVRAKSLFSRPVGN